MRRLEDLFLYMLIMLSCIGIPLYEIVKALFGLKPSSNSYLGVTNAFIPCVFCGAITTIGFIVFLVTIGYMIFS